MALRLHIDKAPRGTRWVLRPRETTTSEDVVDPETGAIPATGWGQGLVVGRPRALESKKNQEERTPQGVTSRTAARERGSRAGAHRGEPILLARAGLLSRAPRRPEGTRLRTPHDGRMVDALALAAEEGRGHAAKCPGEALAASDPGMSEWGNPPGARPGTWGAIPERAPGELKHLSTPRNREDSLSSGERTGRSPNPAGGIACRRCQWGVGRVGRRGRQPPRRIRILEPKTAGTGHRRG